ALDSTCGTSARQPSPYEFLKLGVALDRCPVIAAVETYASTQQIGITDTPETHDQSQGRQRDSFGAVGTFDVHIPRAVNSWPQLHHNGYVLAGWLRIHTIPSPR